MRYVGIPYSITSYGMLPGSTAIINASVIGPIVSFKKNWMMPIITFSGDIVSIGAIIYKVNVVN